MTPRSQPDALIGDARQAAAQVLQMIQTQTVNAVSGEIISLKAETVCLHGDGAHALEFARIINAKLAENDIAIKARALFAA